MIPAFIITVLFIFDHNVSSLLAQVGLHLKKPTAYHWNFMVMALMILACGFLVLPPANGVIPQAPMHSRANTVWRKDKKSKALKNEDSHIKAVEDAPFNIQRKSSFGFVPHDAPSNIHDDIHGGRDCYIIETRVSNLIQSTLCVICLLITPVLQLIPRSGAFPFHECSICSILKSVCMFAPPRDICI